MLITAPLVWAKEEATDPLTDAWLIDADYIEYDQVKNEYYAQGHATVTRQGRTLTADEIRLNNQTRQAQAIGNVRLQSNGDLLNGQKLRLHLDKETGLLENGSVFISQNHLYLSGDRIEKTGPQTYSVDRATITTCDGPDPDWHITSRNLQVTIEGYGHAKHAALWAKKLPVFYTPYLIFPVKLKRQSGLLTPEPRYSGRKGYEYLQPLYWAINKSSDATLYAHSMSERGLRLGVEYRYMLSEQSKGTWVVDGFNDSKVDDGQNDNSELWGYTEEENDLLRPNQDRYWLRAKHDQELPWELKAKLDVDLASDQDYLHEFKTGYYGFEGSEAFFQKIFGRDMDDYTDTVRINRLNINRTWNQYTLNTDLRWNDDIVKRRQQETDNTLQQLPFITVDGARQKLGSSNLQFNFTSSYGHLYRQTGTRGHRLDLYPRVYYPLRLYPAVRVEPSAGIRQTAWRIDSYATTPDDDQRSYYRTIYDLKLDTSTEFYRIYSFHLAGCDRLKHAVTPQITYEYIPDDDQSKYPNFDSSVDRIDRKNLITYSITNTLTARRPKQLKKSVTPSTDSQRAYHYQTFLRLKLEQSFDINKHNEYEIEGDPEPFSDITAELDFTPSRFISIDAEAVWSMYNNHYQSHSTALRLWNNRSDSVTTEHSYQRESKEGEDDGLEIIRIDGRLNLNQHWQLTGAHERNLYDGKDILNSLGLYYQTQCWALDTNYTKEEDDESFAIIVHLLGLGDITNR